MLILALLFLSSLISKIESNENATEIFNTYKKAVRRQDGETLLIVLAENFSLYDCHGKPVLSRNKFIEKIEDYDADGKLRMRNHEIQKVEWINNSSFLLIVIVSDLGIVEYEVDENGQISSENHRKCPRKTSRTTSLIDDFLSIALTLTRRYLGALMRIYHFDDILHRMFTITRCDGSVISRNQLLKFFNYTDGNIVTANFGDMWIPNEKPNGTQRFSFYLNIKKGNNTIPHSIILFEAVLVSGLYQLVSEKQIKCSTVPQISGLIDEYTTKRRTIRALEAEYNGAIMRRDLGSFQKLTSENMTIKLCTKPHHELDIFMKGDDYFEKILAPQLNSIDHTSLQGVSGNLLTGELKWAIYSYRFIDNRYLFEARPNPKTGKLMISFEERLRCLNEQEIDIYHTYLQEKMQELIDDFVTAINTRNKTQFAELTGETFRIGTPNYKNQTIVENVTKISSSYRFAHPKLIVYKEPTMEKGFIKFSAKGEWLDNRYTAKMVNLKYILVNETRRDWIADLNRLDKD